MTSWAGLTDEDISQRCFDNPLLAYGEDCPSCRLLPLCDKRTCPRCGSLRTKHTDRIAVCYACDNTWLLPKKRASFKLTETMRWVLALLGAITLMLIARTVMY